ncbi:MAG: hypothetical protein ACYCZY_03705 [Lacisediminihabitans sp.]
MRLKILFLVGLGVGYVLGARAGRARYEQLKAKATEAWEDPRARKVVAETQEFVKENAPIVQARVAAAASTAASATVSGARIAAEKTAETAREFSGRVATTAKGASAKVAETAKGASGRAAETASAVKDRLVDTSTSIRDRASGTASLIKDRGEEMLDQAIISASKTRDEALEDDEDL